MAVRSVPYISESDYLEAERQAHTKSEYLAGQVFAMAGASFAHVRITGNLLATLHQSLRSSKCVVLSSDMQVKIPAASAYFYSDVAVVYREPQFEDEQEDNLLNPVVIIGVLSPSNEAFDRGEKFLVYQRIPSLREYPVVSQDKVCVEQFIRQPDGQWLKREYTLMEQVVHLESMDVDLPLHAVYEGIAFPSP